MRRRNLIISCVSAVTVSLVICMLATAEKQNAMENADEFVQKIVSQAEDESLRRQSDADSNIEWQDSDDSGASSENP